MLFANETDLELQIINLATQTVLYASVALILLIFVAAYTKERLPKLKLPLFILIAITMLGSTAILLGSTIYLNTKSESGGPVHWHADIEVWACGAELDLRNPIGALSNKIGSATYHEHDDKRIHLEGVVVKKDHDASLRKFFDVAGGDISTDSVTVPLDSDRGSWLAREEQIDGDAQSHGRFDQFTQANSDLASADESGSLLTLESGRYCSPNDQAPAELQVFVFEYDKDSKTYTQRKLSEPASYIMRDESVVPPGDCIIIDYDTPKLKTERLCEQYGVRDEQRCTEFGVSEFNPELCNLKEVESDQATEVSAPLTDEDIKIFACVDYLKNRGNPAHNTLLPENELQDCQQFISNLEKECADQAGNPTGVSSKCHTLIDARAAEETDA